jgi:WbqC-like protein family
MSSAYSHKLLSDSDKFVIDPQSIEGDFSSELTAGTISVGKTIAIVQSNYIPWRGYFDMINQVDELIFVDDLQYTRRDWRNRNKIKTPRGSAWLTIPVEVKGKRHQKIKDTVVSDSKWGSTHWKTIVHNYSRAKYFSRYKDVFEQLYLNSNEKMLSQINYKFLTSICELLRIRTKLTWSSDYRLVEGKTERLIDLCKQAGGNEYLSGPTARSYMDEGLFRNEGIAVRYMDYSGYLEYEQLYPPFEPKVSIIDLIFNEGPDAAKYLKRC